MHRGALNATRIRTHFSSEPANEEVVNTTITEEKKEVCKSNVKVVNFPLSP